MERHRFTVDPESAGTRLDVYLAGLLPQHSRSQLQRLVKGGGATLGGKPAKPNATVKGGDVVEIEVPDATPGDAGRAGHRAAGHLPGRRRDRGEQAGGDGGAPGGRPRPGHAGERAAVPRGQPERRRRRAAAGDRAPAGPRHLGADGGREERPGAPGADAAVPRSRGREGVPGAGVGRRARGAAHRPAGRDATRCTARRCPRARAAPAPPSRASPGRATCAASAC